MKKMKKGLVASLMLVILISALIASAEKCIPQETVSSQASRPMLTTRDLPALSQTIVLSKSSETKKILKEIKERISTSGGITKQALEELVEEFEWKPFNGIFVVNHCADLAFIPGFFLFILLGMYLGSIIVGTWEYGFFQGYCNGIIFLGLGLAFTYRSDPEMPSSYDFGGVCALGFYKPI